MLPIADRQVFPAWPAVARLNASSATRNSGVFRVLLRQPSAEGRHVWLVLVVRVQRAISPLTLETTFSSFCA